MLAAQLVQEPLRPIIMVSPDQSKQMAQAMIDIANQYNLTTVFSPKTQAWLNLGGVMAMVYTPKFMMLSAVIKASKAAQAPKAPTTPSDVMRGPVAQPGKKTSDNPGGLVFG